MLIIWGVKTALRLLGIVTVTCQGCGNPAAARVEEHRRVLSLFFIPLLPIGRKTLLTCTYCGRESEISDDQVDALLAQAHDVPDQGTAAGQARPETLPGGRSPEQP